MDGRDLTPHEGAFRHPETPPSAGDRTAEEASGSLDTDGDGDRTAEEAVGSPPPAKADEATGTLDTDGGGDWTVEEALGSPPMAVAGGESCDALARAISSTLGAVMREFDSRAGEAARSQDDLSLSLDRLTGELDKLLEDAPLLIIMQHAVKITSIRKRVSSLTLLLKSIQRRIDNIDCMISTGVPTGKVLVDAVETSQLTL